MDKHINSCCRLEVYFPVYQDANKTCIKQKQVILDNDRYNYD